MSGAGPSTVLGKAVPIRLSSVHAQHPNLHEKLGKTTALGLIQKLAD